jgi:hypothetical protein
MTTPGKVVLHSLQGYRPELDAIVVQWIQERVKYVGIVGVDVSRIEDIIDDLCVGDGSNSYYMVTVSHSPDETLQDAIFLAEQISVEQADGVSVVEF